MWHSLSSIDSSVLRNTCQLSTRKHIMHINCQHLFYGHKLTRRKSPLPPRMEYIWHLPLGSMGGVFIDPLEWMDSKKWRTLATSVLEALQPAVYRPSWDGASSDTMKVVDFTLARARMVRADNGIHRYQLCAAVRCCGGALCRRPLSPGRKTTTAMPLLHLTWLHAQKRFCATVRCCGGALCRRPLRPQRQTTRAPPLM